MEMQEDKVKFKQYYVKCKKVDQMMAMEKLPP